MSCSNCNCSECASARDYNSCWDCQDDPPIHQPRWQDAEPANEQQAKAWTTIINRVIDQHGGKAINLPALLYVVIGNIPGLKQENRERVSLQVERLLHESPDFNLRKGKSGGVFRQTNEPEPKAVISNADNYTCKGCGNNKLNNISDKSCWGCGRTVGT